MGSIAAVLALVAAGLAVSAFAIRVRRRRAGQPRRPKAGAKSGQGADTSNAAAPKAAASKPDARAADG